MFTTPNEIRFYVVWNPAMFVKRQTRVQFFDVPLVVNTVILYADTHIQEIENSIGRNFYCKLDVWRDIIERIDNSFNNTVIVLIKWANDDIIDIPADFYLHCFKSS